MPFGSEQPIRSFEQQAPAARRRAQVRVVNAELRADVRLAVASIAAAHGGALAEKRDAIEAAMRAGRIPPGRVYSLSSIRKLEHDYTHGKRSVADFRDDVSPRGPRPEPISEQLADVVRNEAQRIGLSNRQRLLKHVNRRLAERGEESITRHKLTRVLQRLGPVEISGARHGSRAAEMDAMPRYMIPARYTHDLWKLDEGDSMTFGHAICPLTGTMISIRPAVVFIRDRCSGAIVSYHVPDPTRRIHEDGERCCRTGFDALDVEATVLSAACPDVAPPETRWCAGYLPRELRWDNAKAHQSVEDMLTKQLRITLVPPDPDDLDEDDDEIPFVIRRTGFRRPDRNGGVERIMPVFKSWSAGGRGDVRRVIPADYRPEIDDAELGRLRSMTTVSGSDRQPRLTRVPVESLPSLEEIRTHVGAFVREYNEEHVLKRHGTTPRIAAQQHMPRHARKGIDLVRKLEPETHRVQRDGIPIQRDGRITVFDTVVNGLPMLIGSDAIVYVDPLLRGIWREDLRGLSFLKPALLAAEARNGADVAATAHAAARRASDDAAVRARAELVWQRDEDPGEPPATPQATVTRDNVAPTAAAVPTTPVPPTSVGRATREAWGAPRKTTTHDDDTAWTTPLDVARAVTKWDENTAGEE